MVTVRPVDWATDTAAISALDTSFTTDRIYHVEQQPLGFTLVERAAVPPLTKSICHLDEEIEDLRKLQHVVVAVIDDQIIGLAGAHYSDWNGRVVLWHLYVQPDRRGSGAGRALMQSVVDYAGSVGAWCVWLEAQNVNLPAIRFYQKCGFQICGVDTHLYHPQGMGGGEVAVFLAMTIPS